MEIRYFYKVSPGDAQYGPEPTINPYQAPQVNLAQDYADDDGSYWRDGKFLILKRDGQLPARCTKCNDTSALPMRKKTLAWHHPAWYLVFFIHPFLYLIVGLVVRKRVKIEYGLCESHLVRLRIGTGVSWFAFLTGMGSVFWMIEHPGNNDKLIGLVIVGFLVAIIFAIAFTRSIYARKIDADEIRIAGCGEPFLESAMERIKY